VSAPATGGPGPFDRSPVGALSARLGSTDTNRWITGLSIGGLVAAALLALIGGMPFDLPMPTHGIGLVTPTCGLTRGSTALIRGDAALAWRYNPASLAVIAFGIFGLARAAIGFTTKRWLNLSVRLSPAAWIALAVVFAILWVHQQGNAEFVMNARL
jgi:hypothetical protein